MRARLKHENCTLSKKKHNDCNILNILIAVYTQPPHIIILGFIKKHANHFFTQEDILILLDTIWAYFCHNPYLLLHCLFSFYTKIFSSIIYMTI